MIIDTHAHFYDPSRAQGVPWPEPENELLYRTVLPEHFKALAEPHGVRGTVVVEASVWPEDNQWILDLAAGEPAIVGFVGNLDPMGQEFRDYVDRFSSNPLFRGIRVRGTGLADLLSETPLANLEYLAGKDLSLDVLANADNLDSLAQLATSLPTLRLVINHVAHVVIDGAEPDARWQDGMERAGQYTNVFCKVSGMVEKAVPAPASGDPEFYAPVLDVLWRSFGSERLVYGSNWPVCERAADYATVFTIASTYFRAKGDEAWQNIFWKNARAAYKWIDRSP